jgi:hypothetical protein
VLWSRIERIQEEGFPNDLLAFITTRMRMSHICQPLLIRALADAGESGMKS